MYIGWAKRNFFKYDGIVNELAMSCSVLCSRSAMQTSFIEKTTVGHNKEFKEITWFYVSNDNPAGTTNPEPDSYVTYNYEENCMDSRNNGPHSLERQLWCKSCSICV